MKNVINHKTKVQRNYAKRLRKLAPWQLREAKAFFQKKWKIVQAVANVKWIESTDF